MVTHPVGEADARIAELDAALREKTKALHEAEARADEAAHEKRRFESQLATMIAAARYTHLSSIQSEVLEKLKDRFSREEASMKAAEKRSRRLEMLQLAVASATSQPVPSAVLQILQLNVTAHLLQQAKPSEGATTPGSAAAILLLESVQLGVMSTVRRCLPGQLRWGLENVCHQGSRRALHYLQLATTIGINKRAAKEATENAAELPRLQESIIAWIRHKVIENRRSNQVTLMADRAFSRWLNLQIAMCFGAWRDRASYLLKSYRAVTMARTRWTNAAVILALAYLRGSAEAKRNRKPSTAGELRVKIERQVRREMKQAAEIRRELEEEIRAEIEMEMRLRHEIEAKVRAEFKEIHKTEERVDQIAETAEVKRNSHKSGWHSVAGQTIPPLKVELLHQEDGLQRDFVPTPATETASVPNLAPPAALPKNEAELNPRTDGVGSVSSNEGVPDGEGLKEEEGSSMLDEDGNLRGDWRRLQDDDDDASAAAASEYHEQVSIYGKNQSIGGCWINDEKHVSDGITPVTAVVGGFGSFCVETVPTGHGASSDGPMQCHEEASHEKGVDEKPAEAGAGEEDTRPSVELILPQGADGAEDPVAIRQDRKTKLKEAALKAAADALPAAKEAESARINAAFAEALHRQHLLDKIRDRILTIAQEEKPVAAVRGSAWGAMRNQAASQSDAYEKDHHNDPVTKALREQAEAKATQHQALAREAKDLAIRHEALQKEAEGDTTGEAGASDPISSLQREPEEATAAEEALEAAGSPPSETLGGFSPGAGAWP